jgi:hypothetical protein
MAEVDVPFWGIHVTGIDGDSLFLQKSFIGLGWHDIGDLSKLSSTRDAFKEKIADTYADTTLGVSDAAPQEKCQGSFGERECWQTRVFYGFPPTVLRYNKPASKDRAPMTLRSPSCGETCQRETT